MILRHMVDEQWNGCLTIGSMKISVMRQSYSDFPILLTFPPELFDFGLQLKVCYSESLYFSILGYQTPT